MYYTQLKLWNLRHLFSIDYNNNYYIAIYDITELQIEKQIEKEIQEINVVQANQLDLSVVKPMT